MRWTLTEEDFQRGSKKRELDELKGNYIREKGFTVLEIKECEYWRLYKTSNNVKKHMRENFQYRRSLAADQLLEEKKTERYSGTFNVTLKYAKS